MKNNFWFNMLMKVLVSALGFHILFNEQYMPSDTICKLHVPIHAVFVAITTKRYYLIFGALKLNIDNWAIDWGQEPDTYIFSLVGCPITYLCR